MLLKIAAVFFCILLAAGGAVAQTQRRSEKAVPPLSVKIVAPSDGATVDERPLVEGGSSSPEEAVWVIVHPLDVSQYWVQPHVNVRKDGKWTLQAYVGRGGSLDSGKHFEILAVVKPKGRLREGAMLEGWPEAEAKSEVIDVVRQ